MCSIQNEINKQTKYYKSLFLLVIFEIISLGLYYTYWCFEVENIFKDELSNNKKCEFSFVIASLFKPVCNSLIQSIINENIFEEEKKRVNKIKLLKEKTSKKQTDDDDSFFDYSDDEIENKVDLENQTEPSEEKNNENKNDEVELFSDLNFCLNEEIDETEETK